MKTFLLFLCFLISWLSYAQEKTLFSYTFKIVDKQDSMNYFDYQGPLKVYLKDSIKDKLILAQSPALKVHIRNNLGYQTISNATVTLEGFNLPAIVGQYDAKHKYYYFDTIPKDYNTIMVYHAEYEEKGYQNIDELPKEITFNLIDKYKVAFDALNSNSNMFFKSDLTKMGVIFQHEISNPVEYFKKNYPNLNVLGSLFSDITSMDQQVFIVNKTDGQKFKRFNDKVIKEMLADKNIHLMIGLLIPIQRINDNSMKQYFDDEGTPSFIPKYVKYKGVDLIAHYYHNPIEFYNSQLSISPQSVSAKCIENPKFKECMKYDKKYRKLVKKAKLNAFKEIKSTYKFIQKNSLKENSIYERTPKELNELYEETYNHDSLFFDIFKDQNDTVLIDFSIKYNDQPDFIDLGRKPTSYFGITNKLSLKKYDYKDGFSKDFSDDDFNIIINTFGYLVEIDSFKLFSFKNTIASPFGIADLVEYYQLNNEIFIYSIENLEL